MSTPRVCWVYGNVTERVDFLNRIREQFKADEELLLDEDMSFAYQENQIIANSVFSETKLVLITGIPEPASTKQTMINNFKKLLDGINERTLIVFYNIDPASEKALSGHVAKIGKMVVFPTKIEKGQGGSWVVKEADRLGKSITPEDAEIVVASCGYDAKLGGIGVDRLRLEMKKLAAYVGRRKNITAEDVNQCAYPTEEFVLWSIFNAMDSKSLERCNSVMHKMCLDMDSVVEAVNALFNISIGRYRLLFFLKEGLAKGLSKSDVAKEAATFVKLKQSGTGFHMKLEPDRMKDADDADGKMKPAFSDFAITEGLHGAFGRKPTIDLYSRRDLARIVSCLQDGLCEVRNRTSEYGLLLLADVLFLTICTQTEEQLLKAVRTPHEFEQI